MLRGGVLLLRRCLGLLLFLSCFCQLRDLLDKSLRYNALAILLGNLLNDLLLNFNYLTLPYLELVDHLSSNPIRSILGEIKFELHFLSLLLAIWRLLFHFNDHSQLLRVLLLCHRFCILLASSSIQCGGFGLLLFRR